MTEFVDYRSISLAVRGYFVSIGLSMTDAAKRLGVKQPALSAMLSGRKITKRTALLLASEFPFNVEYLTGGVGQLLVQNDEKTGNMPEDQTSDFDKYVSVVPFTLEELEYLLSQPGPSFDENEGIKLGEDVNQLASDYARVVEENKRLRQCLKMYRKSSKDAK